uniref:Uncharacterized protein n=1 Tax=Anguilla anguilla TaxID=7936 RepID=A0A0E9UVG3_ANGAN
MTGEVATAQPKGKMCSLSPTNNSNKKIDLTIKNVFCDYFSSRKISGKCSHAVSQIYPRNQSNSQP